MKKSLLALLAVSSFVACNRDDNKFSEATPPHIIGVWKLAKIEYYSGKDGSLIDTDIPDECKAKGSLEFTKDGKVISKTFATFQGECIEDGSSDNQTYEFDPVTKILKNPKTGETGKVFLTNTELHFLDGYAPDLNKDGVADKSKEYYKRVK